jgi:ABC-type phosphate/phosphonate transport system substrate-binding protein
MLPIVLGLVRQAGLDPQRDVQVRRFDVLVGKHGDHVGGERDALASVQSGDADACAVLDLNWERWSVDGTVDPHAIQIVASTPRLDHCVFTARSDLEPVAATRWLDALFSMRYDNPSHKTMMDLEGLQAWLPGRTSGFAALTAAVAAERFFESGPAAP